MKSPGVVLRRIDEKARGRGGWRCSSVVEFIRVLERKNWKSCLGRRCGGGESLSPVVNFPWLFDETLGERLLR